MTTPPLFPIGFAVRVDTSELDDGYATQAEWDAYPHRFVQVAATPDPGSNHGLPPAELFAGYRWAAGVLARLILLVQPSMKATAEHYGHRCTSDPDKLQCGTTMDDYLTHPITAVTGMTLRDGTLKPAEQPPLVEFVVPTTQANGWVRLLRTRLSELLAEDMTILGRPPTEAAHGPTAVITASAPQPRRTDA